MPRHSFKFPAEVQQAVRTHVEAAIRKCYEFAKLPPPVFEWVPSPIVACLAGPIAHVVLRRVLKGLAEAIKSDNPELPVQNSVRNSVSTSARLVMWRLHRNSS